MYTKLGVNFERGNNAESLTTLSRENLQDPSLLVVNNRKGSSAATATTIRGSQDLHHSPAETSVRLNRVFTAEAGIMGSQVCGYLQAVMEAIPALLRDRQTGAGAGRQNPMSSLQSVVACGASTLALTWKDEIAAQEVWCRLQVHYQQHKARMKELAAQRKVPVFGRAHLVDLFEIETGFFPHEIEIDADPEPLSWISTPTGPGGREEAGSGILSDLPLHGSTAPLPDPLDLDAPATTATTTSAATGVAIRQHQKEVARLQANLASDWADEAGASSDDTTPRSSPCPFPADEKDKKEEEVVDPRFGLFAASTGDSERRPLNLLPRSSDGAGGVPAPIEMQPVPFEFASAPVSQANLSKGPPASSSTATYTSSCGEEGTTPSTGGRKQDHDRGQGQQQHMTNVFAAAFDESSSEDGGSTDSKEGDKEGDWGDEDSGEAWEGATLREASEQWACPTCTFLNSHLLSECEMCGCQRRS